MKLHILYIILFLSLLAGAQNNNQSVLNKTNGSVYHICDVPENIVGNEYWNSEDDKGVALKWDVPYRAEDEWYNTLSWDEGINNFSLGMEGDGDYSVAIRWDSNELAEYDGDTLKKMRIFVADEGFSKLIVKVWTGEHAANNIYADTISIENLDINEWNEFSFKEVLTLDATMEYWVGYRIIDQQDGYNPVGCWKGDCTLGYSDMVSFDAEEQIWDFASTWSNQYIWNIQLKVSDYGSEMKCKGFVLLRQSDNISDYTYYDFIPNKRYYEQPVYFDNILDFPKNFCYKVASLWVNSGDSCLSGFANDTSGSQDFICVNYSKINENNLPDNISIYPNPASTEITLESNLIIKELAFYNLNGKEILSKQFKEDVIDISFLKKGFYLLDIKCEQGKSFKKKLIKR